MTFLSALTEALKPHQHQTMWLGYSGGMDSHVLLHALVCLQKEFFFQLNVIHINHHLNPQAEAWAKHCQKTCEQYGVNFICEDILIDSVKGKSIEALAREKRYQVFARYLQPNDVLLTAHHLNDQAETLLTQLCRGTGLKGLAAMPASKRFAKGFHLRPFLSVSRDVLWEYGAEQDLVWIDDESNDNLKFTRNFIRHQVLPVLISRWPSIQQTLSRSTQHFAEAQQLLESFAEHHYGDLSVKSLSVSQLLSLTVDKRKLVLRTWIHQQGYPLPSSKKINNILDEVLLAACDRNPIVTWGNVVLRRYRDALYLMQPFPAIDPQQTFDWDLQTSLTLPALGELTIQLTVGRGLRRAFKTLRVGFRQGGESMMINSHRRPLKNLFQEWGIPPWERERTPLIFCEDQLIHVVGYAIDARYQANEKELGYQIVFNKSRPEHSSI